MGYTLHFPNYVLVDHRFPEVQLWNTKFPVDEEVWLTPDSVAIGKDDVVGRALAWIKRETVVAEGEPQVPNKYTLSQNYPNPFNPSTTFTYELPHASRVSLRVYNTLGQEVATLVDGGRPAGVFTVHFDVGSLPSGMYYYRLQAGNSVKTNQMVVTRWSSLFAYPTVSLPGAGPLGSSPYPHAGAERLLHAGVRRDQPEVVVSRGCPLCL